MKFKNILIVLFILSLTISCRSLKGKYFMLSNEAEYLLQIEIKKDSTIVIEGESLSSQFIFNGKLNLVSIDKVNRFQDYLIKGDFIVLNDKVSYKDYTPPRDSAYNFFGEFQGNYQFINGDTIVFTGSKRILFKRNLFYRQYFKKDFKKERLKYIKNFYKDRMGYRLYKRMIKIDLKDM